MLSEKRPIAEWGRRLALLLCLDKHFGLFWFGFCFVLFFSPLGVQQGFHMQEIQELLVSKLIVLPHYLDSFLGLPHFPHRS